MKFYDEYFCCIADSCVIFVVIIVLLINIIHN
jgi:hypothetical protein